MYHGVAAHATHANACVCRFTGTRDDRESAAHYGIMGYFDPSRITESTIRDSIRESPSPSLGSLRVLSDYRRHGRETKRGREKGTKDERKREEYFNRPVKSNMKSKRKVQT